MPFTCFYTSDSGVTTDFYDFVFSRSYLSGSGDPDERDRVLDNADASELVPGQGSDEYDCQTTEFCYDTSAFKATSVSSLKSRSFRIRALTHEPQGVTWIVVGGVDSVNKFQCWRNNAVLEQVRMCITCG